MKEFLDTNIVSLAPESMKVGTSPFWKLRNAVLLVASAFDGQVIGSESSSINIPDLPGVFGICARRANVSGCEVVKMVVAELAVVELAGVVVVELVVAAFALDL